LPNIDFTQLLIVFAVLLVSLTVHEAAHAWSADQFGDPTARTLGRVSLNPAVHVDLIGTIVFPLIALSTGVPVLGWAKPVPVNVRQLGLNANQKFMAVSAAGPASNLLIAVVCSLALRLLDVTAGVGGEATGMTASVLVLAIRLNVLLAIFNMLPIPPLDGGNVLSGLLHGSAARAFDSLRSYGFLILYGLLFTGVLWSLVSPPENFLLSWLL